MTKLTRDTLGGKAWDPIRRGKAVILLIALAEMVGWKVYGTVMKPILNEGRTKPVTHKWLWDRFLANLPDDQVTPARIFLERYIFNKPSYDEFRDICRSLGLEFPSPKN